MMNLDMINNNQSKKTHLKNIKNIYIVMSGKGGVGKSTISSIIASGLSMKRYSVGILDCDFHGPSIPFLFGIGSESKLNVSESNKLLPIYVNNNLKLMSMSFLLDNNDQPIIWRGPMKMSALSQFIDEVEWGVLDYLIIDLPPGTGDEVLNIIQKVSPIDGAIVVTIPQDVSLLSVRKSLSFLNKMNIKIIGIVSNMSGLTCPHCNHKIDLFLSDNINNTLKDYNLELLADIEMSRLLSNYESDGKILEFLEKNNNYIEKFEKLFNIFKKINDSKI